MHLSDRPPTAADIDAADIDAVDGGESNGDIAASLRAMPDAHLVVIAGPTAAGKSDLAVALANRLGGEIVNADSMQLYRGMDVGTAKPSEEQRRIPPHHLYDIWEVTERASVADYQDRARPMIAAIRARGQLPVLVGGSGLYLRAVVDEIAFPGTDATLRGELESRLAAIGPAALHAELSTVDPTAAAAILPSNGRRIVRALEVSRLTGRPFSASLPSYAEVPGVVHLGLDAADLDDRITGRVHRMWAAGLVEEVRGLAASGLRDGPTASRALGYRQLLDHLAGRSSEAAAREATVAASRRFARRQRSWFRRDPRIDWLDAASPSLVDDAIRRTLRK